VPTALVGLPRVSSCVDNNATVLDAVAELLRSKSYHACGAVVRLAAWNLITTLRPTYANQDVVMPKLDGSQVCWLVQQDPA